LKGVCFNEKNGNSKFLKKNFFGTFKEDLFFSSFTDNLNLHLNSYLHMYKKINGIFQPTPRQTLYSF